MPEVKDWLIKANGDLSGARKMLKDDDDTLHLAAYLSQQVAEKALKAFLLFKQCGYPKIHDLARLLKVCISQDCAFAQFQSEAEALSAYATYARYPDGQ